MSKKKKITIREALIMGFIIGCIASIIRHFVCVETEKFWQELVIWAIIGLVIGPIVALWLNYRSKNKKQEKAEA